MTSPLLRVGANTGTLTTSAKSIFDAQRGADCTFRFDLIDGLTGQLEGTLTPYADTVPSLSHDTTTTIKRQLSLSLGPSDTAAIDTIKHRIAPVLIAADGSEWPLGRYMFSTNLRNVTDVGRLGQPALMDEAFIMDQPRSSAFPRAVSSASSTSAQLQDINDLVFSLMQDFPTVSHQFDTTPYATTSTWAFGTTSWQVLSDLALLGGFFSPWMDNDGQARLIQSFDPARAVPLIDWDRYFHVYSDGVTEEDDLLTAANRFIIVANSTNAGTTNGPVTGTYDVPSTAPYSITNRGFVVPEILQIQIESEAQAQAIADSIGIASTVYERTTMTTFPDPRHDSYDVIRWQGANWLELSWSMDMIAGGNMTHTLRKTYTA